MIERKSKYLDVLVPRGLVEIPTEHNVPPAQITAEGLCAIRIGCEGGVISSLEVIHDCASVPLKLLLPRLAEPHAHIDKAFTWGGFPNLQGDYQGSLDANFKEHESRTAKDVYSRAERALKLAVKNGSRAIRSHVDSFGSFADESWEALVALRSEWRHLIELQLVALVPLEYWSTQRGNSFAKYVASVGGLLGGVFLPPFDRKFSGALLFQLLQLANALGCGIDLHIDESQTHPAAGLTQLVQLLDQTQMTVPITCSHSSSMGLLPQKKLQNLAKRLAHHQVNVVALPTTNAWLLGRHARRTPVQRPLAPICQLQQAGVTVAIGCDNVQDPWFPVGDFDPLSLMSLSMPIAQLAPWQRVGLAPFTTSAAAVMELKWDGIIRRGGPADLIMLEANSWSEALSFPPPRKIMVNGAWLDQWNLSTTIV